MSERGTSIVRSLALALSLTAPSVVTAGGSFEAGLAAGASSYDRRSGEDVPGSVHLRSLKPHLRFDGLLGSWGLRALAQRRFEFYSGDAIDRLVGSGPHTHDRVSLRAERRFSETDRLDLDGGYVRSNDVLEAEQGTVVVDGNVKRWNGALGTRWSLFEGSARLRATSYDERPALAASRSFGWTARLFPLRQAEHSAFAGVGTGQLNVGDSTVLLQRSLTAGYRRRLTSLVTAEIEAGAMRTRFSDGALQVRPLVAIGLERDPRRGSALGLALRSRFEGDSLSGLSGEARWRLASGRIWLTGESVADAEGGIDRSATRTRRIGLGVEDTLGRANVVGFEGSYIRTRPLRGTGDGTTILRSSGWVMRRLQPWLNARIAASYLREPFGRENSRPILRVIRLDAELIVLHGGFGASTFKGPAGTRSGRAG